MAFESVPSSPLDSLWQEYARVFRDWDDLTLGRWLAQTLRHNMRIVRTRHYPLPFLPAGLSTSVFMVAVPRPLPKASPDAAPAATPIRV